MAVRNFIVAIELGSTKITGIAGQKKPDGSIAVLSVVSEDATQCIRKGVVYNIDKTVQCITGIVQRLRSQLHAGIRHVYVGVGGQSIHSELNVIERTLTPGQSVTQEMTLEMMDQNRSMEYPDMEILDVEPQGYYADSLMQIDPVGVQCTHLQGTFLNILQSRRHYNKLNTCFENAGVQIAEMYLAPFALADAVLTPIEKRSGCILVDLGADTTTVMVYHKDTLRHIAVIPLGGNNITKDICSLQLVEETEAEQMKLRFASAYTPIEEIDKNLKYEIDSERSIDSIRFIEIVEARVWEIIENVWWQVPQEYKDKIMGGIVLTGGASNMKNIEMAFRVHTHIDKVRTAKFVTNTVTCTTSELIAKDGTMNTLLGLLAKGDQNCWLPEEQKRNSDIFNPSGKANTAASSEQTDEFGRPITPGRQQGVVMTAAEKAAAEKAEREKAEKEREEKEKAEKEAEERAAAEEAAKEAEKNKNGYKKKIIRWLTDLTRPDEE